MSYACFGAKILPLLKNLCRAADMAAVETILTSLAMTNFSFQKILLVFAFFIRLFLKCRKQKQG